MRFIPGEPHVRGGGIAGAGTARQPSRIDRFVITWSRGLSPGRRYLLTFLVIGAALGLRWALGPILGPSVPFITFYPAVLLAGLLAGWGPGLLTTCVCALAGLLLIEEGPAAHTAQLVRVAVFVLMSSLMVLAIHCFRGALRRSESMTDQLVRSQELMRLLIESAKDYAILTLDPDGRVALWGAGAERLFGYDESEVTGKDANILFVPEDVRRGVAQQELQRAVMHGRCEDERWHQRKDGSRFYASGVVRPLRNGSGQLIGFAKIARDITEQQHSEEELRTYRERLEELVAERTEALKTSLEQLRRAERLASIGTLAAGVAHEINNPLNSILLTADYARRFPEEVKESTAYETIMTEAKRCGRIVRGILRFAKDEKTPKEAGDLHDVIHRVAGMMSQYVPSERLWLDLDLAPFLPRVPMNPTEIEQVLVNLVRNAVEASGGEDVRVVIRTTREQNLVVLRVEDNGPGMDAETLAQIFDPFFSTHQHAGGTGLGLSICHGIVTDHGGTICAQSRPGEGTMFTIRFPTIQSVEGG